MTSSSFGAMPQENATTMSSSEQPSSRISLGSSENDVKYDSPNKNSEDLVMNGGDIEEEMEKIRLGRHFLFLSSYRYSSWRSSCSS